MFPNAPSIRAASSTRDVYVRLKDEPMGEQVGAVARVALSERAPEDECPAYLAAVENAVATEPPPFGTEACPRRVSPRRGQPHVADPLAGEERPARGPGRHRSVVARRLRRERPRAEARQAPRRGRVTPREGLPGDPRPRLPRLRRSHVPQGDGRVLARLRACTATEPRRWVALREAPRRSTTTCR